MLRLIIILLIIYIFVRFYKHLSLSVSSSFRGQVRDDRHQNQQPVNHTPPFDDVEEAEFVEIKEDNKEGTGSEASK